MVGRSNRPRRWGECVRDRLPLLPLPDEAGKHGTSPALADVMDTLRLPAAGFGHRLRSKERSGGNGTSTTAGPWSGMEDRAGAVFAGEPLVSAGEMVMTNAWKVRGVWALVKWQELARDRGHRGQVQTEPRPISTLVVNARSRRQCAGINSARSRTS
jgi:hypothetical protein